VPIRLLVLIAAAAACVVLVAAGESRVQASGERAATATPHSIADYPWRARVRTAARFARRRAGIVSFAVLDENRRLHGFHAGRIYPSASVVKVMLMVAYLNRSSVRHRRLHRSDRRLMGPMIRRSDNATASAIYSMVGDGGLRRVARRAGMRRFHPGGSVWGLSRITARDQAHFMIRVDRLIPARHRAYALHLLTEIVRRQRWGMPGATPHGWLLHFKGGFVPEGSGWKTHQVALLTRGGRRMSVAVLSRFNPSLHYGGRTIQGVTARLFRGYDRIAESPQN
jgi:hypothetical protein